MGRPLLYDEVPVGPCKVRALFSWSGETAEDLGFVEGDIIEVLNTGDGDWWTGKLKRNRMVGHFPRNFAEYVDENQETMSAAAQLKAAQGNKLEPASFGRVGVNNAGISLQDLQIGEPMTAGMAHGMNPSISSSLGASGNSQRSTKSAQEILKDISDELNRDFLQEINIKSQPEEFLSPELGFTTEEDWGKLDTKPLAADNVAHDEDNAEDAPPVPPHKVSPSASIARRSLQNSTQSHAPSDDPLSTSMSAFSTILKPESELPLESKSSALTGPALHPKKPALGGQAPAPAPLRAAQMLDPRVAVNDELPSRESPSRATSPSLNEEVPFDPKAYEPERPIGDHIGSHLDIDTSAYSSGLGVNAVDEMSVPKTRNAQGKDSKLSGALKSPTVVMFSSGEDDDSSKNKFFEKLFPKNSQVRLHRSTSRSSHKSSRSSISTKSVKSKLRGIKSMFSFVPSFKPDEDIYPTNGFTRSDPRPANHNIGSVKASALNSKASTDFHGPLDSTVQSPKESFAETGGTLLSEGANKGGGKWIQTRRDLYRAKTLTERDISKRRRSMELQGINCDDIIAPLKEQAESDFHDYRLETFSEVDTMVMNMTTWPQLMTPAVFASSRIGRHFKDPVERVRAVFLVCAAHIAHVGQTQAGNNVMQSRQATPQELSRTVAAMVNALDVECLVVEGHIRAVAVDSQGIESSAHAWNAVKVEGEWRFLDCFSAAAGSSGELVPGDDGERVSDSALEGVDSVNLFYFLTPPTQLIFTHVPADQKLQFLRPSLPTATAALLPISSPAAFAHGILLDSFWLGMTRLSDLEMSEISLSVPNGSTDLVARVQGGSALAQEYTSQHSRKARIKSFVPHGQKQAVLQIFAVNKLHPAKDTEDMELLWTLELRHVSGDSNNAPFEFIHRYTTPNAAQSDLYVVEPQCRLLGGGDLYTFRVNHSPAEPGLTKKPQLAIQSPSGRITKLIPFGTDIDDSFKASVKTLEVGSWRAVVRKDDAESWAPFAEWFCE